MSRNISQATFDDVVRENMGEFEMSAEEAVADAVEQFKAQGVNLGNIVQEPSMYLNNADRPSQHFVETTAISLRELISVESPIYDVITPALETIRDECAKDLAHRCLAGKQNAYQTLLLCLKKSHLVNNVDVMGLTLEAFINLCNGQPDYFNTEGADEILKIFTDYTSNMNIIAKAVKLLRFNCIKHEGNRVMLFDKHIVAHLMHFLTVKDCAVMIEVSKLLRVLTSDDDVRVPFGKGMEHAKLMVTEHNLLNILANYIKEYQSNSAVLSELILTLSKLVTRDEYCITVYDTGLLPIIISAITTHIDIVGVFKGSLLLLKAMAGNDKVKHEIVQQNGADSAVLVLLKHQANPGVNEVGCAFLAALALRNPQQCPMMMESGVHRSLIQAMKVHLSVKPIQKCACMALRNLVSHSQALSPHILELGAEALINESLRIHGDGLYEAKAALRDLGCDVQFNEPWKGEKGHLARTDEIHENNVSNKG